MNAFEKFYVIRGTTANVIGGNVSGGYIVNTFSELESFYNESSNSNNLLKIMRCPNLVPAKSPVILEEGTHVSLNSYSAYFIFGIYFSN